MLNWKPIVSLSLAACLWVGCDSSGDATDGADAEAVTSPCAVFSEEIALGLGNGPYKAGQTTVQGTVSLCMRIGETTAPNIYGATARFERMTKDQFLGLSCRTPIDPETHAPLYDVDTLTGIHEAACRFKPFGEVNVGIQVLTSSGWAIMVGSAPQEKCLAAIEAMIPKLPK